MSEERKDQQQKQPDRAGVAERVERAQKHIARAEEYLEESAELGDMVHRLGNWVAGLLSRGSDR
ncbi:MAG TPA: hypothetical protein VMW50_06935 [Dehalococcoidia bacterium]|nr:hypothetical protein [Dehalococcoidia bacterium]